jgi:hypothetical protein
VPVYRNNEWTNEQGQTTSYDVQELERNGQKSYVVSESPENTGPGFDDMRTQQMVARDACSTIQAKDEARAHEVEMYQQRPDGNFDKVDFRYQAQGTYNETWHETERTPTARQDVEREVQSDLHAARETPQQAEQRQEFAEMRGPEIDRGAEQEAQRQTQQAFQQQQQDSDQVQKHSY